MLSLLRRSGNLGSSPLPPPGLQILRVMRPQDRVTFGLRGGLADRLVVDGAFDHDDVLAGVEPVPSFDPDGGLSFVPRPQLVAFVDRPSVGSI